MAARGAAPTGSTEGDARRSARFRAASLSRAGYAPYPRRPAPGHLPGGSGRGSPVRKRSVQASSLASASHRSGWSLRACSLFRPSSVTGGRKTCHVPRRTWLDDKIDVFLDGLAASGMHLDRHRAGELITGHVRAVATLMTITET